MKLVILSNLAFDDLGLLADAHTNRTAERLCKRFGLGHLERKDFGTGESCEGCVFSESFGHTHGDGGFTGTGLTGDEDGAACDFLLFDHVEDDTGCATGFLLADHAFYVQIGRADNGWDTVGWV